MQSLVTLCIGQDRCALEEARRQTSNPKENERERKTKVSLLFDSCLCIDDYDRPLFHVGNEGFGFVFKGELIRTRKVVPLQMPRSETGQFFSVYEWENKAKILFRCSHPNIVKHVGTVTSIN